jgi:flagellar biogenesis protein FliO
LTAQFSFDGALTNAFRAAHFRTFPWIYATVYALIVVLFYAVAVFLSRDAILEFIQAIEALENADLGEAAPREVMAQVFATLMPFLPIAINVMIGSWVVWAVFEAASQRRYVRDERFSLRLGADELRMMVVGLLWTLLNIVCFLPMLFVLFGAGNSLFNQVLDGQSAASMENEIIASVFGALGLMLLLFPIYVFLATRLSPCFAMTIKDGRIVFFDAWNVSRGRFWPILGAFLIIAIAGGIVSSVVDQAFQFGLAEFMSRFSNVQSGEEVMQLVFSAAFLVPTGLYIFASMFMSALRQHFNGAPAAFAARHDPRGGVYDAARMAVFD